MPRTLWYDPDCGFCTRSAGTLVRLGVTVQVRPLPRDPAHPALLADRVDHAAALARIHLSGDGATQVGHRAIAATLASSRRRPVRVAGAVLGARRLDRLAARVYDWVAQHRHRLPGGSTECRLPSPDPPLPPEGTVP